MAASLQSHLLRSTQTSPEGCFSTLKTAEQQRSRNLQRSCQRRRLFLAGGLGVALFLLLGLVSQVAGPCGCGGSIRLIGRPQQQPGSSLGPTTDVPVMTLPPFTPTCFVREIGRDTGKFGLPILSCRLDANCTVHDPTCCSYLHYEMLTFFHRFLVSKCLQHEYVLAHGTALGAIRDSTIIPHTQDLDLAVTPLLIQFLELNSTREELWRHGYAVFMGEDVFWKLHPHIHHPKPEFRAAFRAMGENYNTWQARTNGTMAVYLDLWPMWQVPADLADCGKEKPSNKTDHLAVPWDDDPALWDGRAVDTCSPRFAPASGNSSASVVSAGAKVCSIAVKLPWNLTGGGASAKIGNETFPVPANYDEVFKTTYGGNWRIPDTKNRGTWPKTRQGWELVWALQRKLSLTAWGGNMSLDDRDEQCKLYY